MDIHNGDKLQDVMQGAGADDQSMNDPDLELIKQRVKEMEEEAEKIKLMQSEVEKQLSHSPATAGLGLTLEEKVEIDSRSIYVGNVDYGATAEELEQHFHGCGSINRVTIQCDKYSGHPKGFAYIEFADKDSVPTSQALDESLFRGRQIKVLPKRTNRPGISTTNRRPGRFRRGGGGGGGSRSSLPMYGMYRPVRRSYRRRASWFYPY